MLYSAELYGKSSVEAFYINEILDTVTDLTQASIQASFEKDEVKKAELMKKLVEEVIPLQLGFLDAQIKKYGKNGFGVGSEMSLADIIIFNGTEAEKANEAAQKFPKLNENLNKTEEHPKSRNG